MIFFLFCWSIVWPIHRTTKPKTKENWRGVQGRSKSYFYCILSYAHTHPPPPHPHPIISPALQFPTVKTHAQTEPVSNNSEFFLGPIISDSVSQKRRYFFSLCLNHCLSWANHKHIIFLIRQDTIFSLIYFLVVR